ncbi:hypothetical protein [Corynebacterium ulcerans]|nr:hypothetical protein [Corynebacterium ulcerans]
MLITPQRRGKVAAQQRERFLAQITIQGTSIVQLWNPTSRHLRLIV